MKKAFKFIETLTPLHLEVLGYPTLKIHSDFTEVRFEFDSVIRDLSFISLMSDEFRMFSKDDSLVLIYTFYESE